MSAQNTVYLNLREITELHKPDIQVKDVAEIYCSDTHVQNRCASLKIKTIREQKRKRYEDTEEKPPGRGCLRVEIPGGGLFL